jgi:ferritin-like protein
MPAHLEIWHKKYKYKPCIVMCREAETIMPEEITNVDKFVEISARAEYCNIKRLKDTVKLKLRTPKKLYTLKVAPINAEEIIKKIQCEIREI